MKTRLFLSLWGFGRQRFGGTAGFGIKILSVWMLCGEGICDAPARSGGGWDPFQPVRRPAIPWGAAKSGPEFLVRNPVDAFVAASHAERGLKPRPEAPGEVLLRRLYLDLVGVNPTPEEQEQFLGDQTEGAYERWVDRLLGDPRYGERWGRHWMDVWRYSDWAGWSGGNQIRDSKPHVWRWRDWIVESLNEDKGYDRMMVEMLAADEAAPEDPRALRATGFLVRNFKLLSREQWLEDTIKHTSQAFLGLTLGCAKCHDHMHDAVSQKEYYQVRAVFEPHQTRTDRVPGELDRAKNGLARVYDTGSNAPTYFFMRGDERRPDTNQMILPDVPKLLGGRLEIHPISLPKAAARPDRREFVIRDTVAAGEREVKEAEAALERAKEGEEDKRKELELEWNAAAGKHRALLAVLRAESAEEMGKGGAEWREAALAAGVEQRDLAVWEAKLKAHRARVAVRGAEGKPEAELEKLRKKLEEAEAALAAAEKEREKEPTTEYKARSEEIYPFESTGRRLAFARWLADEKNPLTARVAMNHIWLRHFGRGIVSTPADFGRNGRPPSHPELLDWLAAEFMARGWSMKAMHRLLVTSSAYRMSSTGDEENASRDPDNVYLWRMPSRRLEAEVVRDNLLFAAGNLDRGMGGPEIDHALGLTSKRRSLYLRIAAEKEVEFLKIFDGPSVTECYERRPTVLPQQALALANSELTLEQARVLAGRLLKETDAPEEFIRRLFLRVLARRPTAEEERLCREFLAKHEQNGGNGRGWQNLALVLLNHNDAVTVR